MHFAVSCFDKEGALQTRMDNRDAHLKFIADGGLDVVVAGPMLSDDEQMIGSHFILQASSKAELEAAMEKDPYAQAGLFDRVVIQPMKLVVLNA